MITKSGLSYQNFFSSKLAYCLASVVSFASILVNVTPSEAAQIKYSSQGNVSAIDGLVIDDITYDITFKYDTFVNLFGYVNSPNFNSPTFWNNPQKAKKAVDSIIALFDNQQKTTTQLNSISYILIPYQGVVASNSSTYIRNKIGNHITYWSDFRGESKDIELLNYEKANYAVFTSKSKVPEPSSTGIIVVAFLLGIKHFQTRALKYK
ncbi:hypothetical protein I8748_02495 [Nostoc sp. CENA67]|uniref:PEP-CTERM sorting domain-containing protein n=1 Tax=Amazonocrinis nigriterrae CENA67 TaxID=2794033 RepID=A0A8J7HRP6_9NOST|nr:hypothetical protein [Amazonocrinis nigriterrae]MBH8561059.1 hypothetical protein [Amazonocrinis nigriterrae CENA67]